MTINTHRTEPNFIIEEIYKRTDIHDQFGGSYQSGISSSARLPCIFIFSGKSGHIHGYKDQWENPDVFSYTGEGQTGDMKLVRGNLQLKNHLTNGKRIYLFSQVEKAYVKFEAELELLDLDFFPGLDREGKNRMGIKFFFKRRGITIEYLNDTESSINRAIGIEENKSTAAVPTEKQTFITSRVGQGAYRKSILHRWQFKCAVTSYAKKETLIASHIVSWKIGNDLERLDVHNGILLSPTYDALFDKKLIGFENSGKIILSNTLLATNYTSIGITGKETIRNFSVENHSYLEKHRAEVN